MRAEAAPGGAVTSRVSVTAFAAGSATSHGGVGADAWARSAGGIQRKVRKAGTMRRRIPVWLRIQGLCKLRRRKPRVRAKPNPGETHGGTSEQGADCRR